MVVIWYAIGIYIVGVAVVLYMRPKLMFQPGGMWKEFGLATQRDYTVFPFWMFALVWSVLSYALATLISLTLASIVLQSSSMPAPMHTPMDTPIPNNNFMTPVSSMTPPGPQMAPPSVMPSMSPTMPSSEPAGTMNMRSPGYYVLDTQPRYVYWGPEPPKWP